MAINLDDIDDFTKANMNFFDKNYSLVDMIHLNDGRKRFFGNKENRICRFCGKKDGETTFKNIAHAIPEFIGNKLLFAYHECDNCNLKFSTLLEANLANYMSLSHTLSQVKGKRGVPSFRSNKKKSRIDITETSVRLDNHDGDSIAVINEKNKTITITSQRPGYIPVAIYKCFTKMALTIMPEQEIIHFKETLDWINEEKHDQSEYTFNDLKLLKSFISGVHPFDFLTVGLFKRKADIEENVPYMIFFVAYSNYVFQIYLPLSSMDIGMVEGSMSFFPTAIDMIEGSNKFQRGALDMRGKTLVKGEIDTVVMGFKSLRRNWRLVFKNLYNRLISIFMNKQL